MKRHFLVLSVVSFFLPSYGFSQTGTVQATIPKTNVVEVDGKITPAEKSASKLISLSKIGTREVPSNKTDVHVAATDKGLYFGFVCSSPSENYRIKSAKANDAVFEDESVQIFITPNQDATTDNYFHFAVNPRGHVYSNRAANNKPLANWDAKVTSDTKSWIAEIFIPLSAIDAPLNQPYWRANVARNAHCEGEEAEVSAWVNPAILFGSDQTTSTASAELSLHNYKRFGFFTVPSFIPPPPGDNQTTATTAGN